MISHPAQHFRMARTQAAGVDRRCPALTHNGRLTHEAKPLHLRALAGPDPVPGGPVSLPKRPQRCRVVGCVQRRALRHYRMSGGGCRAAGCKVSAGAAQRAQWCMPPRTEDSNLLW